MVATTRQITLEELERGCASEGSWEIVNGEMIEMPPSGGRPSRIAMEIGSLLVAFVKPRRLGSVYGADGGFILAEAPLTLRAPDVGFVRTARLPENYDDGSYLRIAPDLVVEVISPSDRMADVLAKVVGWLNAGTAYVWLVDPDLETVTVYSQEQRPLVLTSNDTLDGGEVLPGFSIPVSEIFAR